MLFSFLKLREYVKIKPLIAKNIMIFLRRFSITTKGFCDLVNVTDKVEKVVNQAGIDRGLVCVFVKGSTVGVTTMEYEPNLVKDFCELMEKIIPQDLPTHHGKTWGDDNGFSHLRASLLGPSVCAPVKDGKLELGTWQQIVVCDFDNREREREVCVQVLS